MGRNAKNVLSCQFLSHIDKMALHWRHAMILGQKTANVQGFWNVRFWRETQTKNTKRCKIDSSKNVYLVPLRIFSFGLKYAKFSFVLKIMAYQIKHCTFLRKPEWICWSCLKPACLQNSKRYFVVCVNEKIGNIDAATFLKFFLISRCIYKIDDKKWYKKWLKSVF